METNLLYYNKIKTSRKEMQDKLLDKISDLPSIIWFKHHSIFCIWTFAKKLKNLS